MELPEITVDLSWPPSINHYWRHDKGRTHLTKRARDFRNGAMVDLFGMPRFGKARVWVRIDVYEPDKRIRDLDNLQKPILDALQYARIIDNDSQVDDLHTVRAHPIEDGKVTVHVGPL